MAPAMTDYEAQRLKNMANNRALLISLGLDKPMFDAPTVASKVATSGTANTTKKRARPSTTSEMPRKKKSRPALKSLEPDSTEQEGLRRSSRNSGRRVSYVDSGDKIHSVSTTPAKSNKSSRSKAEDDYEDDSEDDNDEDYKKEGLQRKSVKLGVRTQDPKVFGPIEGVPVGKWWATRAECSTDAIHAPYVSGISGNQKDGAYSVALSGGYEDDIDLGYAFTFTGAGGRDLKGTKQNPKNLRTAPQSCDQTFDNITNRALQISSETKKPVRVIRGFKLKSKFAPETGYRYDGLYVVEKAWMEVGLNEGGWKVCKYALTRLGGQPPLPERNIDEDDAAEANGGALSAEEVTEPKSEMAAEA